ncbi:zf-HC2 domain-containing protein [Naumannella cuiyingiana]|uniref:Anti-sigma factor RsiW n=1 Tax=Naumannella cuiyingiana TaxID=1347891 RepID=A0A7Z0DAJ1_9ACTN|nr:zf-HC2 domain-containing protein [Naumannella cuiyingiana]NYI71957.1 anti-sigma factor RsiW [Naumannella cuiyingiana]
MISFRAGCQTYADKLSAYVDAALPTAVHEEIATHVAGCPDCRAEVASLRHVRSLLRSGADAEPAGQPVRGPQALPDRLRSIAGESADQPLWARPFDPHDRPGAGFAALPSNRRDARRRRLITTGSLLTLLVGVALVGWVAAPPSRQVVVEPTAQARAGFASALNQMPLSNAAVGAVAASPGVPLAAGPAGAGPVPQQAFESPVATGSDCQRSLHRAQRADAEVSVSGVQTVQHLGPSGWVQSTVSVENLPGFGTSLSVLDGADIADTDFVPVGRPSILDLSSLGRFELSCRELGGSVAGRPAATVDARMPGESDPRVRWWIDAETGYLLWTERYAEGRLVSSAGFTSLTFGAAVDGLLSADPPGGAEERPAGPSRAPQMGGLQLLSVRGTDDGGCIESVYGDGLTTLTVSRQPGTLVPGDGMTFDAATGAWRAVDGAVTVLAWQSGGDVWTVVTDGSAQLVESVSGSLPHAAPTQPGPFDRILAGLDWIASRAGIR